MKKNMERQALLGCFKTNYIAHRGLFDNSGDSPENSISAFKKAVNAGYGIELDIQLSKDKQIVVTHDYDLKRICGVEKTINDLTYQELSNYKILNSNETIPLFSEVLKIINGKVPLIVEIKTESEFEELCKLTSEMLSAYSGDYCIESFSPFVITWYKRHYPEVIRGQLADDFVKNKHFKSNFKNWILTNMIFNFFGKPDFIAYNHNFSKKKCIKYWKNKLGCTLVGWTIKSQEELDKAIKVFEIIIFDSFIPKINNKIV